MPLLLASFFGAALLREVLREVLREALVVFKKRTGRMEAARLSARRMKAFRGLPPRGGLERRRDKPPRLLPRGLFEQSARWQSLFILPNGRVMTSEEESQR